MATVLMICEQCVQFALQVRWSSESYALLARVDPSESKQLAVRVVADVLLEVWKAATNTLYTWAKIIYNSFY